jgi:hypothetical protein
MRVGSSTLLLVASLSLGCGSNSSEPGEGVSGIDLYASLSEHAQTALDKYGMRGTRQLAELGIPGEFKAQVMTGGSCTGLGSKRLCLVPMDFGATSYASGQVETFVSSRVTYGVRFHRAGCWRARAVRMRNDYSGAIPSTESKRVGFLANAVKLSGCVEPGSKANTVAVHEPPRPSSTKHASSSSKIVPGKSIGGVALGETLAEVRRTLGKGKRLDPELDEYRWNVLGGTIDVSFDQGPADALSTTSSEFLLNGVSVGDSFETIRRALPQWDAQRCPGGDAQIRLLEGLQGPTTAWIFNGGPGISRASSVEVTRAALDPPCTGE